MNHYLVSFPASAMDLDEDELHQASVDSHAVVDEAKAAGVWVFGGGIDQSVPTVLVDGDGASVEDSYAGTTQLNGGFTVLRTRTRDEALEWAARIARACRCAQEVRVFMWDPAS
ncbi:YciI family protein [Demequina sp. NBRC 110053]|uniref:YciI family protein n=1 Tax=Demequina sp. NBRC 110053 TaxID=1570342 RepID=UPI000A076B20|nr:YciI family protein [Demequina sp. NBRC 110053]